MNAKAPLSWPQPSAPASAGTGFRAAFGNAPTGEDQQNDYRLQQSQRWEAVGRLAGGVFHDFNNLLTGLTLYCDLLLAGLDSGDRVRRYADEIRSATLQASGLVRQLLALSRQRAPEPKALFLNDVITNMEDLLARLVGETIKVTFNLAPELGLVRMDPAQAQQILLNLVLNARDALPQGGEITVESSNCRLQGVAAGVSDRDTRFSCVLLIVWDNGSGMDAKTREHLFEPFFTTKNPEQGNGIGLTTVHHIVSRSGGLIHVDSEPGRGTRVTILLPRVTETAADACETPSQLPELSSATPLQPTAKELIL
jgi:two-component system, cell cycle sensor histidine kinase and response regulator CckA